MDTFNTDMQIGDSIEFNTNRPYSVEGQRIKATVIDKIEDGFWLVIDFVDIDRKIKAEMKVNTLTQSEIMFNYDNNLYS